MTFRRILRMGLMLIGSVAAQTPIQNISGGFYGPARGSKIGWSIDRVRQAPESFGMPAPAVACGPAFRGRRMQ